MQKKHSKAAANAVLREGGAASVAKVGRREDRRVADAGESSDPILFPVAVVADEVEEV